jgi:hypothetical protein
VAAGGRGRLEPDLSPPEGFPWAACPAPLARYVVGKEKEDPEANQGSPVVASRGHHGDPRQLYLGLQTAGAPVKIW